MAIKARRGTNAQRTGITFEDGEICWTTDTNNLYIGDGSTAGGILVTSGGALSDVVDDTTPQLGGNLDVNGNSIVSTSNGDITLTPNGTGNVLLGNYEFDVDQTVGAGQDNYVLTYDNGTGHISLEAAAGGGLGNVVEDTTPQLGGQLDVNGNAIGDGTNELLTFTEDASAVNHVNIENEATGSGPIISAAGDDANVDLNISAKGTGNISVGNFTFDADQTVGAGQDNYVLTYDNSGGTIQLEAGGSGDVTGPASSTDNELPRFDSTTGKLLQAGSGVIVDDNGNMSGNGATFNKQTGTTYTLTQSDNGKVVTLNNASAITLTLPQASTEALNEGFQCALIQIGAGQVTVAKEGSDTIISDSSYLKLKGQGAGATVSLHSAGSPNTYLLVGNLVA